MQTHFIFNVSASGGTLLIRSSQVKDLALGIERGEATDGDLLELLEEMLALYIGIYDGPVDAQRSINLIPGPDIKDGTEIHISYLPYAPAPLPN